MKYTKSVGSLLARGALLAAGFAVLSLAFGGGTPASAATRNVEVGDFWFCDSSFTGNVCTTTVVQGDIVSWDFGPAAFSHDITECTGSCGLPLLNPELRLFHSGLQNSGTFEFTFNTIETLSYQCNIHPTSMKGRIIVLDPAVGGVAELPDVDVSPLASNGSSGPGAGVAAALAAAAVSLIGLGGAAWWTRRQSRADSSP